MEERQWILKVVALQWKEQQTGFETEVHSGEHEYLKGFKGEHGLQVKVKIKRKWNHFWQRKTC